ncbi:MAG: peptidase [Chitinophagaceae bacterium]|nr:peptidase [Chitinophagaceae bacterium]
MIKSVKHTLLSFLVIISISQVSFAQGNAKKDVPKSWYQLDKIQSNYYGISLDKAYQFVKDKKSRQVVVAVLDNGVDTLHEDLKNILWHNPKEIPGNGIDDDHNGYVDDIYGWNFIGGKDGRNVHEDTDEGVRVYHKLKAKYGNVVPDPSKAKTPEEKAEIEMYKKVKEKIENAVDPADILFIKRILPSLKKGDSIIAKELNKSIYTCDDLNNYFPADIYASYTKSIHLSTCKMNNNNNGITNKEVIELYEKEIKKAEAIDNPPKDFRGEIVKDDESNINDKYYGNNDVMAGTPSHGTHTSGIIGASRNNGKGMDGIADNVKIMMVRMLGDADEHDKDIALAIRYAVDNGAQIISMSFGKYFSPQKKWVDQAVKYAESKGVLLVHSAGNDHTNNDTAETFPNAKFINGGEAGTFISVGASSDPKIPQTNSSGEEVKDYVAVFSNYGKKEVDVFAPGVDIYSTTPGNNYTSYDGTSMAGPVVAGIAAFLLEYYPDLSAKQLKYVIEKSAVQLKQPVKLPGTDKDVALSDISKTGGFVNAYEAVKLAATLKGERNNKQPIIINSKIVNKKKG